MSIALYKLTDPIFSEFTTSSMLLYGKPRFLIIGDKGTFVKGRVDPQEDALRLGDGDAQFEDQKHFGRLITVTFPMPSHI
jgi:hypothetical protein